jgi:hypothetical protein
MTTQRTDEMIAYCHASHAVVAHLLGFTVVSVSVASIEILEPALPAMPLDLTELRDRIAVEDIIAMRLAGQAGETRYSFGSAGPSYNLDPDDVDVAEAVALGQRIAGDHADAVVAGAWERLTELIDGGAIWPAIEAVAGVLLDDAELTGEEVAEIIADV